MDEGLKKRLGHTAFILPTINYRFEREQGEIVAFILFSSLIGIGGWRHASLLVLFGVLGAFSAGSLFYWQLRCLVRLTYSRQIAVERANFGEQIHMECTLINDKLLPLPWVRVTDEVPAGLTITGSAVDPEDIERTLITQVFAMLPYQRTRRRVTISCDQRGRHLFGNTEVASGDPLGLQQRAAITERSNELIVYPKIFSVLPGNFSALTPLGDVRTRRMLMTDPSRVAGMRAYRQGDPMRHIDWRASARSTQLLVRDFEPTTTMRLVTFFESFPGDAGEFTISVAASIVADVASKGFPTGLFAPGRALDRVVAYDPSSSPEALPAMLELLALCAPDEGTSLASVMVNESDRLRRGMTVVVVSPIYSPDLITAIAECRRRCPVTAIVISGRGSVPPPPGTVDATYTVTYAADWKKEDTIVLSS